MHENSIQAFSECSDVEFNHREQMVMQAYLVARDQGRTCLTDRQVMELLGFTDPNMVRPRITHLVQLGMLEETGDTLCPVTRKTVRLVRLRSLAEVQADARRRAAAVASGQQQMDFFP
jgi:hypothetical protein